MATATRTVLAPHGRSVCVHAVDDRQGPDAIIGHISFDCSGENERCDRELRAGNPFHATPRGWGEHALPAETYHFHTLEAALEFLMDYDEDILATTTIDDRRLIWAIAHDSPSRAFFPGGRSPLDAPRYDYRLDELKDALEHQAFGTETILVVKPPFRDHD